MHRGKTSQLHTPLPEIQQNWDHRDPKPEKGDKEPPRDMGHGPQQGEDSPANEPGVKSGDEGGMMETNM